MKTVSEMTSVEVDAQRKQLLADAKALMATADVEKRSLTKDESERCDELLTEARALKEHWLNMSAGRKSAPDDLAGSRAAKPGEVRVLTREQRMADVVSIMPEDRGLSLGKCIRGVVTGDWTSADAERRAMSEGSLAGGGYMVPTYLSMQVIDAARNSARVMQAGGVTVPMDSATLTIARVASGPTAGWRAESAAITPSDMAFEPVTFTARTLAALCKLSVELFEDARNLDAVVSAALGQALGLELDRAALRGSGANDQPKGILYADGVQTIAVGGIITHNAFSQAVQKIAQENGTAAAAIYSPRTAGELDRRIAGDGQPLQPLPSFAALNKFSTNQVPENLGTGTNESEAYVGDFSQLMLGMRTQFAIEVTRVAADANSSAFRNMEVWIRAYLRADVQLAKPKHFCTLTGIRSAT